MSSLHSFGSFDSFDFLALGYLLPNHTKMGHPEKPIYTIGARFS